MSRSVDISRKNALTGLAAAAAVLAAVMVWMSHRTPSAAPDDGAIRIVSAQDGRVAAAMPATPAPGVGIALHATSPSDRSQDATALLSHDGVPPQLFHIGATVAPGVTLAAVNTDHVDLAENGATTRLYLLGSATRPGRPRQGLDPEPARPSGELPADMLIARMQAAGSPPARPTPEEVEAGR